MSVPDLEDHTGYWLRFVSNQISQAFSAKVEALGVTVAEWVVLRKLFDCDSLAPNKLAAALGLTRGAISKLADRLVEKKLVSRKADTADLRQQRLALTARGRALVPGLADEADRNDLEFFGHLAAKDRDRLVRILKQIAERLDFEKRPLD